MADKTPCRNRSGSAVSSLQYRALPALSPPSLLDHDQLGSAQFKPMLLAVPQRIRQGLIALPIPGTSRTTAADAARRPWDQAELEELHLGALGFTEIDRL